MTTKQKTIKSAKVAKPAKADKSTKPATSSKAAKTAKTKASDVGHVIEVRRVAPHNSPADGPIDIGLPSFQTDDAPKNPAVIRNHTLLSNSATIGKSAAEASDLSDTPEASHSTPAAEASDLSDTPEASHSTPAAKVVIKPLQSADDTTPATATPPVTASPPKTSKAKLTPTAAPADGGPVSESMPEDNEPAGTPDEQSSVSTGPAETVTSSSDNGSEADHTTPGPDIEAELAASTKAMEELDELVEAKTYFLPINSVEKRRSRNVFIFGTILIVLLAALWLDIALDAGLIDMGGVQSVTHFFNTTVSQPLRLLK